MKIVLFSKHRDAIKKLSVWLVCMVMFVSFSFSPLEIVTAAAYTTMICPVKANKDAIITIIMDDGYINSTQSFYGPKFQQYNLKGTTAMIYNWVAGNKSVWQTVSDTGRFEFVSHSTTHPTLSGLDDTRYKSEIQDSQTNLKAAFPGQQVINFVAPNNTTDANADTWIRQYYWADRKGARGFNNLSPSDTEWYDLWTQGVLSSEEPNTMLGWIDTAISQKKWLIEMWHAINEYDPGTYNPPSAAVADAHLARISQRQSEGKVWIATFGEATKYLREKQRAVMQDSGGDTSRIITLTDDLPNDIFDYPITLKSEVPDTWITANVVQSGITTYVKAVKENDGKNYIYYDAIPDKGNISISQAIKIEIGPMTCIQDGKSLNVNFDIRNNTAEDYTQKGKIILAAYEPNTNKLVKVKMMDQDTPVFSGDKVSIQQTLDGMAYGSYKIKAFFWESIASMKNIVMSAQTNANVEKPVLIVNKIVDADTCVKRNQDLNSADFNKNFGTDTNMEVVYTAGDLYNSKWGYLKFNLSGLNPNNYPLAKAELNFYVEAGTASKLNFYSVSDDNWIESGAGGVTWNTKPAMLVKQNNNPVDVGLLGFFSVDLTDYVKEECSGDQVVSIGIKNTATGSGSTAKISSKETATVANKPYLKLTYMLPE